MSIFLPTQQAALQGAVADAFTADELAQLSRYRLGQRLEVLVSRNQGLAADGDAIREILVGQAHQNLVAPDPQFTRLRHYKGF
jgi:hypothetical protein